MEKYKENQAKIQEYANIKTKNINSTSTSTTKPGSLMSKANMVKEYNERNNKN